MFADDGQVGAELLSVNANVDSITRNREKAIPRRAEFMVDPAEGNTNGGHNSSDNTNRAVRASNAGGLLGDLSSTIDAVKNKSAVEKIKASATLKSVVTRTAHYDEKEMTDMNEKDEPPIDFMEVPKWGSAEQVDL